MNPGAFLDHLAASSSDLPSRRKLLQGAAAFAAASLIPGCGNGGSSAASTTTPPPISPSGSNPQPAPASNYTTASLSVSAQSTGTIGGAFAGFSYEKSMLYGPLFRASNSNLVGVFKRLGSSVLRVGGNSVDLTVWNPTGAGQTSGKVAPSDVDNLAAFVKAAGWKCLYGINLGGSASGAQTTALAASEVAYAAQAFGSSLLGIEIGNEPDLFGGTGAPYAGNWSLTKLISLWEQYRGAILAVTPGVAITGPADAGSATSWTIPFGQTVSKSEITLLTQHYYRGNGQAPTSTAQYLVTADSSLVSELASLRAGAAGIGVPYRMAECNSFYNGGASGVSNSFASSLWAIDYLFNCVQGGASGVNFHTGGNGTGYTSIADSGGAVVGIRPEYYGILMFTLAGQGTLYTTQLSAGGLNATAYAVKSAGGGLNIVVVNKDLTQNLVLTTTLPQSATSATLLQLTQLSAGASAPSLTATSSVMIQGAQVGTDGSFAPASAYTLLANGTQLQCYVPALSAVLIQVT